MVGASVATRPIIGETMARFDGGKIGEGGGEHAGDHAAADKALDRPVDDHLVDIGGGGAQRAGRREAGRRNGEQHARRKHARQEARQRDHDDFGDQIGRLHPGDFVGAGAQARLDFGQRGRDDLDVEDRHEHAEHHRQEGDDAARAGIVSRAAAGARPLRAVAVAMVSASGRARSVRAGRRGRCGSGAAVDVDDDRQAGAQLARLQPVLRTRRCAPARAARPW